jgi:ABC-type amino acid transport substrate-binding protein
MARPTCQASGQFVGAARLTPAFTAFAKAQLKLVPAQNLTQAFQKLVLGQVDYVLAGATPAWPWPRAWA